MVRYLLDAKTASLQFVHVPMDFSSSIGDSGNPSLVKSLRLIRVLWRVLLARVMYRSCKTVYYPPSGATRVSLARDVVVLTIVRSLFPKIIFHFHASGLETSYSRRSFIERKLIRRVYGHPDAAVMLSKLAPNEGRFCGALTEYVIPNGVPDPYNDYPKDQERRAVGRVPVILFVGIIGHPKGAVRLLRAAAILSRAGLSFRVKLVGDVDHEFARSQLQSLVDELDLTSIVEVTGVLTGHDKHLAYEHADIMCFPTLFEHETFPLVLLEAQSHTLPVVASDWRAIPDIVTHGTDGFLATHADVTETADYLKRLLEDHALRNRMGAAGRDSFERRFRVETFQDRLTEAIERTAKGGLQDA
jgi:glycosyltransferase involved in cell wall biosynthesis